MGGASYAAELFAAPWIDDAIGAATSERATPLVSNMLVVENQRMPFPFLLGYAISDAALAPLLAPGDIVVVSAELEPVLGAVALCNIRDESGPRCRVWLGEHKRVTQLGRLTDSRIEEVETDAVVWARRALFRVARAA